VTSTRPRPADTGRGRPRHTDAFLVRVAAEYVRACTAGPAPVEAVARRHGDEPVAKVRGWIYQARQRGFLSESAQGRTGGQLTPEATFYLAARTPKTRATKEKHRHEKAARAARTAAPRKKKKRGT
jgi:transposase-like protein